MTVDERALLEVLRRTGYPAGEAAGLVELFAGLHANAASVAGWINEIGALKELVNAHVAASEATLGSDVPPETPPEVDVASA